uniref:Uncharacterized protein n=1 Tax=Anguilla anguilla TaxID=7936 RepID=A0A0E9TH66_ANGAN
MYPCHFHTVSEMCCVFTECNGRDDRGREIIFHKISCLTHSNGCETLVFE